MLRVINFAPWNIFCFMQWKKKLKYIEIYNSTYSIPKNIVPISYLLNFSSKIFCSYFIVNHIYVGKQLRGDGRAIIHGFLEHESLLVLLFQNLQVSH